MAQEHMSLLLRLDDCKEIINKYNQETKNNLQVNSFSIDPAPEVKGFLGEYFNLKIQCTNQVNATELKTSATGCVATLLSFFLKSLPVVDDEHEQVKIFHKESSLYASLLPKLQKYSPVAWCPKAYFCHKNRLVLEDLNCRGFVNLSTKNILTENEMLPVLSGLAAMHASSLLFEFETKICLDNVAKESLKEITVHPDIPWFKTGLNAILEIARMHPNYQTELSQTFITSELALHLECICEMVNPSLKYRNVFCHRDTWGGNVFLNYSKPLQPAVFVDFQTCRYSPAAIDVIFTLYMNLTKQERVEKQSKYIEFYYQQLLEHVKIYITGDKSLNKIVFTKAELLESIEEFRLFGLVYRALALSILKVPKEFVTDYYKNVKRTEKLMQYMKDNDDFNRIMNESIGDIIEEITESLLKS